jgi:cytochrome c-type biogenesis protein CcmF
MTRLIGLDAVIVAIVISVLGVVAATVGVRRNRAEWVNAAYAAVYTTFGLMTIATLAMVWALVTHDFSVSYVAQVGSRATPLFYTVISLWSALEGSILFWGWVLAAYSAAVVYLNRRRPGALIPYAAATLLTVTIFFGILLAGPANPFRLVSPTPSDGPGPNALLQNHILMGVHPPLLYLGYVGMTVPFAFAIGAMLSGEIHDDSWIKLTRRWTLASWTFLSAAIIAGMWWSYEVLGWGGYWVWDPVENASFMPWLTATAFLHSVVVQERRGMLRLWNLSLIVATFLLTILGTFLTRSGVLSSVHAFTQGTIGYFFLAFIGVVFMIAAALVAGTSNQLRGKGALDAAVSRETVFLLNNLVFTAFTFTVVLGTLFPLVAEAVRGVKVSVGAPFFNKMTLPLCALLLFLMGVGPALPWRRTSAEVVKRQLIPPAVGALLAAVAAVIIGVRDVFAAAAFAFGTFALVANLREFWTGAAARVRAHGEAAPVALARLVAANRRRYGGYVAHIGVVSIAVAIAASSTFKIEREATLKRGAAMTVDKYSVRLDSVWGREEPHRAVVGSTVTVLRGGRDIGQLEPRMNFYATQQQPIPTPAVRSRPSGDVYITLMSFANDGSTATLKVIIEPLVPWIWLGGLIVCCGALISMWPAARSRRALVESERLAPVRAPSPAPTPIPASSMTRVEPGMAP